MECLLPFQIPQADVVWGNKWWGAARTGKFGRIPVLHRLHFQRFLTVYVAFSYVYTKLSQKANRKFFQMAIPHEAISLMSGWLWSFQAGRAFNG
jgi:hypothetical protein